MPTILTSVLLSLIAMPSFAEVKDVVEKSFSVEQNTSFTLSNINGSVEIESWSKDEIKVIATIEADDQKARDRVDVVMKQQGSHVGVSTHYEKNDTTKHSHSGEVSYQVWVPVSTNLSDIELVNGSLSIEGVQGTIEAELVNGSVVAKGLASNSELSSVNGSIKAYYETMHQAVDEIDIETVNGSIKLYLPQEVNAKLDIETMHGSIKTDFGLTANKSGFIGRHLKGAIGNGGPNVELESVNGSIKVLRN